MKKLFAFYILAFFALTADSFAETNKCISCNRSHCSAGCKECEVCVTNNKSNLYRCKVCEDGWAMNNGRCEPNPCPGYDLYKCPDYSKCYSCQSGYMIKYKFYSCEGIYRLINGKCRKIGNN